MTPLLAALLLVELGIVLALRARAGRRQAEEADKWRAEKEARRVLEADDDAAAHRQAQLACWRAPSVAAIAALAGRPEGRLRRLERYRLVRGSSVVDPAWEGCWFCPQRSERPGELVVAVEPEEGEPFYLRAGAATAHPRLGLLEIDLAPYGAPERAAPPLRFVLHDQMLDAEEAKARAHALARATLRPARTRERRRAWRRLWIALGLALAVGFAHAPLGAEARAQHEPTRMLRTWAANAGQMMTDEIKPPSWFGHAMIVVWSPDLAFLRTAWFYVTDTGDRIGRAIEDRSVLGFLGALLVGVFYLVWSALNLALAVGFAILAAVVTALIVLYWLGRALLFLIVVLILLLLVAAGAALLPHLDVLTFILIALPFALAARRVHRELAGDPSMIRR